MDKENLRNPASTVDIIVENNLKEILLIQRRNEPFKECWCFPGGYLNYGEETLEMAAVRELKEETNLEVKTSDLILLGNYSSPSRDPRGHVITHVYVARRYSGEPRAQDDALSFRWFDIGNTPSMGFDHEKILKDYLNSGRR